MRPVLDGHKIPTARIDQLKLLILMAAPQGFYRIN
jgi:hypothetical protein